MDPRKLFGLVLLATVGLIALEHLRPPRWVWLFVLAAAGLLAWHLMCPACQKRWLGVKHNLGMKLLNE